MKLPLAVASTVVILAACTGTTRLLDNGHQVRAVTNGETVHLQAPAPAPSDADRGGTLSRPIGNRNMPPSNPQTQSPPITVPPIDTWQPPDRCSTGFPAAGKKHPLPECALQ